MTQETDISILYLDDEDVNLFIFKANFKNKYNILTANSAYKALELLDEDKSNIIIVISDMRMPIMNGLEFIEKAREKHDNIHYYILTGFDYNKEINEALENKVIDKFFSKPFDVKEIEKEINDVISEL